jgi:uncharacterized protein (TIGR03435 family)
VIDRTGLTELFDGEFDFSIELGPPPPPPGVSDPLDRDSMPSLFTVLPEQLGLRLEAASGPVDVLVIDSVEQPSVDAFAAPAGAVQSAPRRQFEVASVKVNRSGVVGGFRGTKGGTYVATNQPLRNLIAQAYGTAAARVAGGPAWIGAASTDTRFVGGDRFDITARLPEGTSEQQVPSMLRALLAERFKLVVHTETREAPIYALVIARGDGRLGPQLQKASIDCETAEAAGEVVAPSKPGEPVRCAREVGGTIMGRGQRLDALALMLSLFADRPVVDQTGLRGGFDFDVRFPELDTPLDGPASALTANGGGIFVAVREQLGLRLEPTRGPLEFVVVDSVEHPTEN